MAKVEGEIPILDEPIVPDEASVATEEPVLAEASVATEEPAPAEAERGRSRKETREETEEKGPSKTPFYLTVACAIGAPLIFLALAWVEFLYFSTAIYFTGIVFIPLGLWLGRKGSTVYTVFMGCILAALFTALYCLWYEFGQYQFDVRAQEAKQRVSMSQPVEGDITMAERYA